MVMVALNNDKIRVLLLGNEEDAPHHPMGAVQERIKEILGTAYEVTTTTERRLLREEHLQSYGICISYADSWKQAPEPAETAGLLRYVAGGGGLLVIHNGISLQASPELAQLIGARFTGHPPYTSLSMNIADAEHPLTHGLKGFTMDEEPYRFVVDPLAELYILLTYAHEGEDWPAAWTRTYGEGRVVYLMPGHHKASFEHEEYKEWIRQATRWAANGDVE